MTVAQVVTELAGCAGVASAARADTITESGADGSAILVTTLNSAVSSRLYPLVLPEKPIYPNIVYQQVSAQRIPLDGYELLRSDRFVVQVRDSEYSSLITLIGTIRTALLTYTSSGNVGSIEIADMIYDYDHETDKYRCNLEIEMVHLTATSQAVNAAYVYMTSASGGENILDNQVEQEITETYSIILVCNSTNIETLRGQVKTCLLGFDMGDNTLEYSGGVNIGIFGHVTVWQENYIHRRYVRDF